MLIYLSIHDPKFHHFRILAFPSPRDCCLVVLTLFLLANTMTLLVRSQKPRMRSNAETASLASAGLLTLLHTTGTAADRRQPCQEYSPCGLSVPLLFRLLLLFCNASFCFVSFIPAASPRPVRQRCGLTSIPLSHKPLDRSTALLQPDM